MKEFPRTLDRTVLKQETEKPQDTVLIYAGQSKRRISFLNHCFPNSNLIEIPGGDEADIPDVIDIMHGKLDHVLNQLPYKDLELSKSKRIALVAADTRTSILSTSENGHAVLESKGKPKNPLDVQSVFAEMARTSENEGMLPFYTVISGSGVHIKEQKREERLVTMHTCTVELDQDYVDYFATKEGFNDYTYAFHDFYSRPPYSSNGAHPVVDLTDLSGGLSLPVLTKVGAVTAVDGSQRTDSDEFRNSLKHGVYNVAVGISPHLLRPIQPKTEQYINQWRWLEDVVAHSLNE